MSSTNFVSFRIVLNDELPSETKKLIIFLINGVGNISNKYPNHYFFKYSPDKFTSFADQYTTLGAGGFGGYFGEDSGGKHIASIHIYGIKNNGDDYYRLLLFLDWLCGFAKKNQCVGIATNDYRPDQADLFFCIDNILYINSEILFRSNSEMVNPEDHSSNT